MLNAPVHKHVSEDKWNMDLDELDPCCQKEIINARHHKRVGDELRGHDVSERRLNEKFRAIQSLRSGHQHHCACCSASADYPLLADLRSSAAQTDEDNDNRRNKVDSDMDSDDEALLAGLDDSIGFTEEEQERMAEAEQLSFARDQAMLLGHGKHSEESITHLMKMVEYGEAVVCHVYQPHMKICALLDLALERLAAGALGTKFRRIAVSPDVRHYLAKVCGGTTAINATTNEESNSAFARQLETALVQQSPVLLCIKSGHVTLMESQLHQFGSDDQIYESDLRNYLEKAQMLYATVEDAMSLIDLERVKEMVKKAQGFDDAEGEVDDDAWCNVPGCDKKFHHQHIGAGGVGSLVRGGQEDGQEALGDTVFDRI